MPPFNHRPASTKPGMSMQAELAGDSCAICKGSFFAELDATKYTVSSYGIRPVGIGSQKALFCIGCGEPLIAPNLKTAASGTEREAFYKSLLLGAEAREQQRSQKIIKNLISVTEFEELKQIVNAQQEVIEELIQHIASLSDSEESESETSSEEPKPEKVTRVRGNNRTTPNE